MDKSYTDRLAFSIVMIIESVTVWAVAKYISIPVALAYAFYLLKPPYSRVKNRVK